MKFFLVSLSLLSLQLNACSSEKATNETAATVTSNDSVAEVPVKEQPSEAVPESKPETPVSENLPSLELAYAIELDATSKTAWSYLDLDSGKIVKEDDATWDLAFKRTSIKMNQEVLGQIIKEESFESVTSVPEGVFSPDTPVSGGLETDGLFFHSPSAWYQYNMETHTISSRGYVYVIKTNEGQYIKLQLTDYYNVDRLPAFIQLKAEALVLPQEAK